MQQLFCCTTTKEQAKRLFFLFPIRGEHRGYAGRNEGKHLNPLFNATGDDHEVLHPNAPETINHPFGRSIFLAPTTNGATYELEWSNALSQLPADAPVFIQVLRHKSPKGYIIIVRPSKREELDEFSLVMLTNTTNRGGVRLKTNNRQFTIRQDDIHANAWAVWLEDDYKFDGRAFFDGETTKVWETRTEWLATRDANATPEFADATGEVDTWDETPRRSGGGGRR